MNNYLIVLVALLAQFATLAQDSPITGEIVNFEGKPLEGASIIIKETGITATTNLKGVFSFVNIPKTRFTIIASYTGYSTVERTFFPGEIHTSAIVIILDINRKAGEEVVVTASRRPEKIVRAPSSISILTTKDVDQSAGYNPAELFSKLQGVEFSRSGVDVITINARGFNNAYNTKILQMTDGRNSMMAGANGLAAGMMNTAIKEDIERIEVALGPNSALYGPNAHNGVLNTLTKDPRKYRGTTIAITGGAQELFSVRLRQATKINERWAFKITGEYTTGDDFKFHDSVYAGGGVYGPSVTIPERVPSYQFRHVRGEAHLFYTITPKSFIAVTYGASENNYINATNLTRNRGQAWKFSFLQARFSSPHLFAQLCETWTNAGKTYGISSYTRISGTVRTVPLPTHPTHSMQRAGIYHQIQQNRMH